MGSLQPIISLAACIGQREGITRGESNMKYEKKNKKLTIGIEGGVIN